MNKIKKNLLKISLILSVVGAFTTTTTNAAEYLVDRTVATANNEIILESELIDAVNKYKANLYAKGIDFPSDNDIRKHALEQLIIKSLILQLAKNNGIIIGDTEINATIERLAMTQGKTTQEIINDYAQQGYTEKGLREAIRDEIIVNEIKRSQVRSRVNISEQEIKQLAINLQENYKNMKAYHLANILIKLPQNPTPAQEDKASRRVKQVQKLLQTQNFSTVAQKYSDAPNAINGGDVGENLTVNDIPSYAVQAVSTANDGDVVGPFKNEMGFVFIKIYKSQPLKLEPVQQVKAKHILLTTSIIFDDEMARNMLNSYRDDIINGDITFEQAARKYSKDHLTAINGGAMDWTNPDVFDPKFKEALLNLKKGEISVPFKSSFGWHITMLDDIKKDEDSIEAFKIKAREMLLNRHMIEESQNWERELRGSSFVQIYIDEN